MPSNGVSSLMQLSPSIAAPAYYSSATVPLGQAATAADGILTSSQLLPHYQPTTPLEPWIEIIDQPKSNAMRFRYECEGRSAGTILGESSTAAHRSFPTIRIHGMNQTAVVVISCVCKDPPYRPHPHSLVGSNCEKGVCTLKVKGVKDISMMNVGIQCCKRQGVKAAITQRQELRVDPFGSGYIDERDKIDLSTVRLCFQAFLPNADKKFTIVVPPVVSNPIVDKKLVKSLAIYRLSRLASYVKGGDEVILLCDKVKKDDVEVRFYQEDQHGDLLWEGFGQFTQADVHHQCAISFKTPPYIKKQIESPVKVFLQLRQPSEGSFGESKEFTYVPDASEIAGEIINRRKRLAAEANLDGTIDLSAPHKKSIVTSGPPKELQPLLNSSLPVTVSRVAIDDESNTSSPVAAIDCRLPSVGLSGTNDNSISSVSAAGSPSTNINPTSPDCQQVAVSPEQDASSVVVLDESQLTQQIIVCDGNGQYFYLPPGFGLVVNEGMVLESGEQQFDTATIRYSNAEEPAETTETEAVN